MTSKLKPGTFVQWSCGCKGITLDGELDLRLEDCRSYQTDMVLTQYRCSIVDLNEKEVELLDSQETAKLLDEIRGLINDGERYRNIKLLLNI